MNFAASTVAIVLFLIPGITFGNTYLSYRFPKQLYTESAVLELAAYVIAAIPVNMFGCWLLAVLEPVIGSNPTVFLSAAAAFGIADGANASAPLDRWGIPFASNYLGLVLVAALLGAGLRRFVWASRLDLRIGFLRMKPDWYYRLQGRLPELPRTVATQADIMAEMPGEESRLYRGYIVGFEVNRDGEMQRLVLDEVERGSGRGDDFTWKSIPGDAFVLLGSEIHSVNLTYWDITGEPPGKWWRRAWEAKKAWWKSFLLQEP